jgi:hypothetical protein
MGFSSVASISFFIFFILSGQCQFAERGPKIQFYQDKTKPRFVGYFCRSGVSYHKRELAYSCSTTLKREVLI